MLPKSNHILPRLTLAPYTKPFSTITMTGKGKINIDQLLFNSLLIFFRLTKPNGTDLPDYISESLTIVAAQDQGCVNASCLEQPCIFEETMITCNDNNLATSTTLLLTTLQNMTVEELEKIEWLNLIQNAGIDADELVEIMKKLYNIERLSLNSNSLW